MTDAAGVPPATDDSAVKIWLDDVVIATEPDEDGHIEARVDGPKHLTPSVAVDEYRFGTKQLGRGHGLVPPPPSPTESIKSLATPPRYEDLKDVAIEFPFHKEPPRKCHSSEGLFEEFAELSEFEKEFAPFVQCVTVFNLHYTPPAMPSLDSDESEPAPAEAPVVVDNESHTGSEAQCEVACAVPADADEPIDPGYEADEYWGWGSDFEWDSDKENKAVAATHDEPLVTLPEALPWTQSDRSSIMVTIEFMADSGTEDEGPFLDSMRLYFPGNFTPEVSSILYPQSDDEDADEDENREQKEEKHLDDDKENEEDRNESSESEYEADVEEEAELDFDFDFDGEAPVQALTQALADAQVQVQVQATAVHTAVHGAEEDTAWFFPTPPPTRDVSDNEGDDESDGETTSAAPTFPMPATLQMLFVPPPQLLPRRRAWRTRPQSVLQSLLSPRMGPSRLLTPRPWRRLLRRLLRRRLRRRRRPRTLPTPLRLCRTTRRSTRTGLSLPRLAGPSPSRSWMRPRGY
jgi:hypothetical protein